MRQINPIGFGLKEANTRLNMREYAKALDRQKQKEIEAWAAKTHTVMELIGGEPTGLIKEMLGTAMFDENGAALVIYLQEIGNWDAFGGKPKPRLREFVTPSKYKSLVYIEKNKRKNERKTSSCKILT